MRHDLRHAVPAFAHAQRRRPRPDELPPDIALLPGGLLARDILHGSAVSARRQNVAAARLLIAQGSLSASAYYKALARHLGLPFVDSWPAIAPDVDVVLAHRSCKVRLAEGGPAAWLVAPVDGAVAALLSGRRTEVGLGDLAIATPAHFAALLHSQAQTAVERIASDALPTERPHLSAKGAVDEKLGVAAALAILCVTFAFFIAPHLVPALIGLLFFCGISYRLVLCAAGLDPSATKTRRLADDALPVYTVLVPLRLEAPILPELIAALKALDYPRAKLEVLVLIEPEDLATRNALAAVELPPWLHVVFGPRDGCLRTKPRALNIGLAMARGALLTVFDAEDRPDPDQLRKAAAFFDKAGDDVACVQARLSIDNGDRCLLARLFAFEYAALFDILNVGTASLRLPMALGGSSNHFRTAVLREAGGWDAWNVTEDADLGLRLARLGHGVACLDSSTLEAAPVDWRIWMKQRRRWTKGWMQTFLVLGRDAPRVLRQLGWTRAIAVGLLCVNLVVGPLLFPWFSAYVIYRLSRYGFPAPHGMREVIQATLEVAVIALGGVSTLWCGYVGMRARDLRRFLPYLPLILPYQLMISVAAWMGMVDLVRTPYHWHKTDHTPQFNAVPHPRKRHET